MTGRSFKSLDLRFDFFSKTGSVTIVFSSSSSFVGIFGLCSFIFCPFFLSSSRASTKRLSSASTVTFFMALSIGFELNICKPGTSFFICISRQFISEVDLQTCFFFNL
ncbi:hypothetical protein Hanom_Chr14g01264391 [Helianthus anomalus]